MAQFSINLILKDSEGTISGSPAESNDSITNESSEVILKDLCGMYLTLLAKNLRIPVETLRILVQNVELLKNDDKGTHIIGNWEISEIWNSNEL